jgi:putative DNA primase/helicase
MWRSSRPNPIIRTKIIQENNKAREMAAAAAAKKAAWIMHQTKMEHHPYLEKKGFPDDLAPVWAVDGKRILVIPMRIAGRLVGVQLINEEGEKKFLYGQVTKGAAFTIDAKGIPIFVEGFATGLSVRTAMKAAKLRYTLHICFSAGNLEYVAGLHPRGFVVADNDPHGAGETAARKTKHPYWLSPATGQDFNDFWLEHGTFQASQSLKSALSSVLSSNAGTSPQSPGPSPD